MTAPLLTVDNLSISFPGERGRVRVVDRVGLSIAAGETLALVGESGCGKSMTALAIMRLVPKPGRIEPGSRIQFEGRDLITLPVPEMRAVRGARIGMIFQEPMTSLNPVYSVGDQIVEAIELHQGVRGRAAWDQAVDVLRQVGVPDPEQRVREYPHQLSGGMRQRAMIAMALSCDPELLIADEPTTALDVTIQAQILELLKKLQSDQGLSILLITHDLGVVAENADRVAVMYASKLMEFAEVNELFASPLHPYTEKLFDSIPRLGQARRGRLDVIPGSVPNPLDFPAGCKFHPRCHRCGSDSQCRTVEPALREVRPGHWAACWKVPGYDQAPQTTPNTGIETG